MTFFALPAAPPKPAAEHTAPALVLVLVPATVEPLLVIIDPAKASKLNFPEVLA